MRTIDRAFEEYVSKKNVIDSLWTDVCDRMGIERESVQRVRQVDANIERFVEAVRATKIETVRESTMVIRAVAAMDQITTGVELALNGVVSILRAHDANVLVAFERDEAGPTRDGVQDGTTQDGTTQDKAEDGATQVVTNGNIEYVEELIKELKIEDSIVKAEVRKQATTLGYVVVNGETYVYGPTSAAPAASAASAAEEIVSSSHNE